MATSSTSSSSSSITGIVSGIDYRSLVDQIILAEGAPATRLRNQKTAINDKLTQYATYRTLLAAVQSAVKGLQDGSAFDGVSASTSALAGSRALATASAGTTATPGTYQVEVTKLARSQKLGSTTVGALGTALGLAGSFTLNGATVTVGASDTLTSLRDKINAANSGPAASKVTASILQVDSTHYRLVLTSDETGAAGMTFSDTGGGVPAALGFTNGANVIQAGAVLVSGLDAQFTVDGVAMTRTSNTVTDAIQGVTLTLTGEEVGAVTGVTVARASDQAIKAAQTFADAWNKLVDFVKTQTTPPKDGATAAALYSEGLLRTVSSTLSRTLLQGVTGVSADLATAGLAGLSLGQDGKLSLNTTKFEAAFRTRLSDLRSLFAQVGTATDARVSYITSGAKTAAGTYAVDITAAATQGLLAGTGFSGTYADDGTADTMTVTDVLSGVATSVSLTNGMTTTDIVNALNSAFATTTKHSVAAGNALFGDPTGTVAATAATTFSALTQAGGASFNVQNGESVDYVGKRGDGSTFSGKFTITNAATTTLGELASQVQLAYGTSATVSVSGGRLVVTDATARTSVLDLTLTANNEGGGALAFGTSSVLATGRPAVQLTATDVGGQVQVNSAIYGSTAGFTVAYTGGGTDGTAQLGLAAGTYKGTDVAGTIGGYAATGTGQTLVGGTGTAVEGLTLSYNGTATGSLGSTTVTLGTGALMQRALDLWLTGSTGTLSVKESTLTARAKALEERALLIDDRLARRKESLLKQYAAMETALGKLQTASQSVTALLNAQSSNNG